MPLARAIASALLSAIAGASAGAIVGWMLTSRSEELKIETARQQLRLEGTAWLVPDSISQLRVTVNDSLNAVGPHAQFDLYLKNTSKWPVQLTYVGHKTSNMPDEDLWTRFWLHYELEVERGEVKPTYPSEQSGPIEPYTGIKIPMDLTIGENDTLQTTLRRHVLVIARTPHELWGVTYLWIDFRTSLDHDPKGREVTVSSQGEYYIECPLSHWSYSYILPSQEKLNEIYKAASVELDDSTRFIHELRRLIHLTQ